MNVSRNMNEYERKCELEELKKKAKIQYANYRKLLEKERIREFKKDNNFEKNNNSEKNNSVVGNPQ